MGQRGIRRRAPAHGWTCAIMVTTVYHRLDWSFITHNCCLILGQHSAAVNAPIPPQVPQSSREQELARQKEMVKCANSQSSSIGSGLPLNSSSVIGSQDSRGYKRPSYSGNSSTHYYTGPHYSQLAAAASSNYNRNSSRYSYYQQHHHT